MYHIVESPQPYFTWDIPGAQYEATFLDSTVQDSLVEIDKDGNRIAIEIPYTMSWDFGRSYDSALYVVPYANRKKVISQEFLYGPHNVILTVENEYQCKESTKDEIFIFAR